MYIKLVWVMTAAPAEMQGVGGSLPMQDAAAAEPGPFPCSTLCVPAWGGAYTSISSRITFALGKMANADFFGHDACIP